MLPIEISVYVAIAAALFFDFVNGFHDSANSIATVVGTRVLRPLYAVCIAAIANFAGPFIFGTAVAVTVGKGIIQPSFSTVDVIFAGLVGAIVWDLVTWYFGLPSSSSHALIGGLIGSALLAGGLLDSRSFVVPPAVILMAATAIGLGTFFGGWRIVKTMAFKLTSLRPYQGFCAETGGGVILTSMAWLGIPVSTTHAIAGAIMGVGATKRLSAVRWGIGKKIVYAWIFTIPASAAVAALVSILMKLFV